MEHIELVNVQQAKSIYVYKCTKGKNQIKTKATVWFDKNV